ncbi:caveolin-1-like [Ptychodera flava]|uniref:caveolin-1-like n=1 Tax=Ptychodera flava TaxID=63121 RepID=UPI00396A3ACE
MAVDPESLDMEMRDPNNLNEHVRALWEDLIGEPTGTHSMDGVWRCSYKCFNSCKACCYKVLTVLCAVPASIYWGCCFAMASFDMIWCTTPCIKMYLMQFGACKLLYGTLVRMCCDPCCESVGRCLSDIRVTQNKE